MMKQVAGKMGGGRRSHGFTCPHCKGAITSKAGSAAWFRAKVDKKKLPFSTKNPPPIKQKDPKYAKMPLSKFLKKYPEWNP